MQKIYESRTKLWAEARKKNDKRERKFSPEIFETGSYLDEKRPFGINWGAYGTMTIAETKEFIKELQRTIRITEKLNNSIVKEKLYW